MSMSQVIVRPSLRGARCHLASPVVRDVVVQQRRIDDDYVEPLQVARLWPPGGRLRAQRAETSLRASRSALEVTQLAIRGCSSAGRRSMAGNVQPAIGPQSSVFHSPLR